MTLPLGQRFYIDATLKGAGNKHAAKTNVRVIWQIEPLARASDCFCGFLDAEYFFAAIAICKAPLQQRSQLMKQWDSEPAFGLVAKCDNSIVSPVDVVPPERPRFC